MPSRRSRSRRRSSRDRDGCRPWPEPFSRSAWSAASKSPPAASSAFLASIMPAPLAWRSACTSFAVKSAIGSGLLGGVGGLLGCSGGSFRRPRAAASGSRRFSAELRCRAQRQRPRGSARSGGSAAGRFGRRARRSAAARSQFSATRPRGRAAAAASARLLLLGGDLGSLRRVRSIVASPRLAR